MPSRWRSSAGRATASRASRRVAHHDRAQPRDRPVAPRGDGCRQAAGGRGAVAAERAGKPRRQWCRRRPVAPHLHLLSPRALDRGADRVDPAHARRAHHAGDRARVPRARGDDGAAARARQAQDPQRGDPVPRAARARAARTHRRGARRALPAVQRGLRRERRCRPRARRPVRRSDRPRPHARVPDARRARGRRAARAHAAAALPA